MERCVEYILTPAASNGGREESVDGLLVLVILMNQKLGHMLNQMMISILWTNSEWTVNMKISKEAYSSSEHTCYEIEEAGERKRREDRTPLIPC